jgi:microsomal dipeptidase-like Zn-dependent dipeptidase
MYLATRALGHGTNGEAIDDESVLLRQVQVMKNMARENSTWMEIAYTPADARRIILEGKLCVILGLESDVFGNFKSPGCNWGDRSEDRPLVTITEADADVKLENKLNEYYALGLRQILPLHYLSKPFGGTAAFNGNTFLPQMEFYTNVRVKTGVPDRIGFSLYEDFPTMPAFVGNFAGYSAYAARIQKQDEGAEISMVSADGLTPAGNTLFHKLMKKGFIIDQEHASYESKRGIINLARANGNYPVMASHCGPQGLSFIWTGAPVRYSGSHEEKIRNFNTSTIRYVAHEMELNDESYNGIRETQGTIGVFTLLNHKRKYSGRWGDIANDCPGSSKTVAQMYCYSLDKMNGKGVGLASDLPMVDGVAPRFGPYSAFALTVENDASLKETQRHANRFAQTNGVNYDVKSKSYHEEFFNAGKIDGFETDVWKALAAWDAGVDAIANESAVSLSGAPGHTGRIRNMVKGLNLANENQLMHPGAFTGDGPWEQAAMFCLKNNLQPENLSTYDAGAKRDIGNMYNRILPTWNLWKAKNGNNEPLRRLITGNRYWDFNLDGLAHYGLMPDLLQDLKNIGFTELQFKPLFGSAEDYIKMWEKAEAAKVNVRN